MHGLDDGLVLVRTGNGEHLREPGPDRVRFVAHAAGDDDAAVFGHRFADRGKAFFLGRIEKTAGVDEHHIGAGIVRAHAVAVRAQAGEDAFGVDKRFGAAEALPRALVTTPSRFAAPMAASR